MTSTLGRSTFDDLAARHRRELHVHCYRMLASYDEAEDAVQETFLRACRASMAEHLPSHRLDWAPVRPNADERLLLDRFIDAHERCDATAAMAIATEDLRVTMPPNPMVYDGLAGVQPLMVDAFGPGRAGDWRLVPVPANRMPAAASYLRAWGDTRFRAFKFDLLRIEDGAVAEITTFDAGLFGAFGLPAVLDEP